ncbi:MAG: response regulator [Elusimicrobia bacterium]|nr:response regulator [Elusimicrobiota bacterium]MBU2614656.1 response regulator [Elusimicrobiota bacterium]
MKKILVVEDEELLSEIFATALKKCGFDLSVANNAAQALEYLAQTQPDLMLLDMKLPDASGLSVLQRTREKYPKLPVIICTAFDQAKLEQTIGINALIHTASDYLVKPVKLQDLTAKVKDILVTK